MKTNVTTLETVDLNTVYMTTGTLLYSKVHEPQISKNYPEQGSQFSVTVAYSSLSDPHCAKLAKLIKTHKIKKQIREQENEDLLQYGEQIFTFSQKAFHDQAGNLQNSIKVVDAYAEPIPKDILIGNGSKGTVAFQLREYTVPVTGKKGIALVLKGLQVTDLVPYERKALNSNIEFKPVAQRTAKVMSIDDDEVPF